MKQASAIWFACVCLWILSGCDPRPMSVPPSEPAPAVQPAPPQRPPPPVGPGPAAGAGDGDVMDQRVVDDGDAAQDDAGASASEDDGALRAAGESCDSADECESGVCEGEGCDPGEGVCAEERRACTRDRRPYCGCDGKTFYSSGSCPGQRFASRGACQP